MPDDLTFMMGKYAARLPADLLYARNHMWGRAADGRLRFGFTAYAVRLMQDVYFLDWCVNAGDTVAIKQQIGNIETSKAVADLFAPIGGTIEIFNNAPLKDPSAINVDCYGRGWLSAMTAAPDGLMDAGAYHDYLASTRESTQRLIKGQINTE